MKSVSKAIGFGIAMWIIVAATLAALLPIAASYRGLYDSIAAVVISLCLVVFSALYLKDAGHDALRESVYLSLTFATVIAALDISLLLAGILKMSLSQFLSEIAVSYLMTPVITIGMGYMKKRSEGGIRCQIKK